MSTVNLFSTLSGYKSRGGGGNTHPEKDSLCFSSSLRFPSACMSSQALSPLSKVPSRHQLGLSLFENHVHWLFTVSSVTSPFSDHQICDHFFLLVKIGLSSCIPYCSSPTHHSAPASVSRTCYVPSRSRPSYTRLPPSDGLFCRYSFLTRVTQSPGVS